MSKLLEVLRRLLLATMYIGVSIFIAIMIKLGYDGYTDWMAGGDNDAGKRMLYFYGIAAGCVIALPFAHKLINWILLKD